MTAAEKRLAAAQAQVDEARQALANAQREARELAAQEADVADARQHLRGIVDQRETAQTVAATLEQVVREREQERAAVILEEWPLLRSALEQRAGKLADRIGDVHARYAAELEPLEAAAEQMQGEWAELRQHLPRMVTSLFHLEMDGLTVPALEPDLRLAQFSPDDPSLPHWLAQVVAQSRQKAEAEKVAMPVGVPVA
jgi:chromosome segregation ATPase